MGKCKLVEEYPDFGCSIMEGKLIETKDRASGQIWNYKNCHYIYCPFNSKWKSKYLHSLMDKEQGFHDVEEFYPPNEEITV